MTRINLFRNAFHNPSRKSLAWGKSNLNHDASALVFAALLIACSMAVGCSSEKPKTETATNQPPMTQAQPPAATSPTSVPMPPVQAVSKPMPKKVVHRVPATVTYADKTSGVSFKYPRKYALKTGDDADELVSSYPLPMNFVQPGGLAIAAVSIPESVYPKSDLASAVFNVSVNKALTEEQCRDFSEARPAATVPSAITQPSKLMIGDMELQSNEVLTRNGTLEETSKYYHVFENGACYEFALKVATRSETDEGGKHVDRDEVFQRLGKILDTVTIKSTITPEVTASAPATAPPAPPANPAQ